MTEAMAGALNQLERSAAWLAGVGLDAPEHARSADQAVLDDVAERLPGDGSDGTDGPGARVRDALTPS